MAVAIPALARRQLVLATAGTMLALLLAALDQTVVGTALPRIVSELKGLSDYPWVITAYLVCSISMTPIAGKLGDLFGRKPLLLAGMSGFMAMSALCGLSANMLQLILFRAAQGLFAGFLFGTVFGVVGDLYPPQRRGRIQGLLGSVWSIAALLGPPVGGVLTDSLGWRWVFYVNIPVGLVALALVAGAMPFARSQASWREIDFRGAATLVAFLASLLVALSSVRDHAWTSPLVSGLLVVAAVMLAVFLLVEVRTRTPIVPLDLFGNPTFAAAIAMSFFAAFGMFATIIYGPLLFQGVLGVSPTDSGALTAPMSLGQIVAAVGTGMLMARVPRYRFFGTVGTAAMIGGLWLMSQISATSSPLDAVRNVVLIGLGLGTTYPLTMNSVQNAVPRHLIGVVSSQVQFFRTLGGTVATAVLGLLLAQRLQPNIASAIRGLGVPPQMAHLLTEQGGENPQTLFDPANLARVRASLPPGASQLFAAVLHAVRVGLAHTLHDLFLTGALIVVVALVASLFLREVPLRAAQATRAVAVPPKPLVITQSTPPLCTVYTAGACAQEPGPGGWAYVQVRAGAAREESGEQPDTTALRLELTAAIRALEATAPGTTVLVSTGSELVQQGMTGWVHRWQGNGWHTADGQPVDNQDLWDKLRRLDEERQVRWEWFDLQGAAAPHGQPEPQWVHALAEAARQRAAVYATRGSADGQGEEKEAQVNLQERQLASTTEQKMEARTQDRGPEPTALQVAAPNGDERWRTLMGECQVLEGRWLELHEAALSLDQEWQHLRSVFSSRVEAQRSGQSPSWTDGARLFYDLDQYAARTSHLALEALQTCQQYGAALQQAMDVLGEG